MKNLKIIISFLTLVILVSLTESSELDFSDHSKNRISRFFKSSNVFYGSKISTNTYIASIASIMPLDIVKLNHDILNLFDDNINVKKNYGSDYNRASDCQTIIATIDSTIPAVNASNVTEIDPGDVVEFFGSASFSDNGSGATYQWDFDDGSPTVNGLNVSHSFSVYGTYQVTLTVTDTNPLGCSDTITTKISVRDNNTCVGALPNCSGISNVPSPTGTSSNAELGIDYGCLTLAPNPRWYFLQSGDTPGSLNFTLSQTTQPDGMGVDLDVDFIIWGPFSEPECGSSFLNPSTQVDCSYSVDATESINIPFAPPSAYYVLLITNFSGIAGYINLDLDTTSTSETNCDIICSVDLGSDVDVCDSNSYTLVPNLTGVFNNYEWRRNNVVIPGETEPTLNVTEAGSYTLIADGIDAIFGDSCSAQDDVQISFPEKDPSFNMSPNCTGATAFVTGDPGGTFSFDPIPTDSAIINPSNGTITNATPQASYTVKYTTLGPCAESSQETVTTFSSENAAFEYTPNCNGATATILGDVGGVFTFNTDPGAEPFGTAKIDAVTGEITEAISGATYDVNYITAGICPAISTVSVTVLERDDPSFTMSPTCDGGFATVTGLAGGKFKFNPLPTDGALLDKSTGLVTNGTFDATYTLQYTTNGVCPAISYQTFTVFSQPEVIVPTLLIACDDMNFDGSTQINLTQKDAEITGGDISLAVTYYETLENAQSQQNAIINPESYTNINSDGTPENPKTIFAVVTNLNTGCTNSVSLSIEVFPKPTPTFVLPELELCDESNIGALESTFDLTLNEIMLINEETNVTVTYHENLLDAEAGERALANPNSYKNTSTPQTIYTRVTNNFSGCYTVVNFAIKVKPLPDLPTGGIDDMIICELNTDGVAQFDLTERNAEILGLKSVSNYTVSYHTNAIEAKNLSSALVDPYTNISNPQTIYVAVTNNTSGCSISTLRFDIKVQEAAQANPDGLDIILETCDDNMEFDNNPNNDSAQFNLNPVNDLIDLNINSVQAKLLDGQSPSDYILSYYTSNEDAESGIDQIPFVYENISNPQVIWARVDNDTKDSANRDSSSCYAIAPITLWVNPIPLFLLQNSYTLCVDTNGTETIGMPVIDTGLDPIEYAFEWTLDGMVIPNAVSESYKATTKGAYGVTVTDLITSTQTRCIAYATTVVLESSPPQVSAEVITPGFADEHVVEAKAIGLGTYEYSIDGGPWQESGIFRDVSLGDHEITARDINGCGAASDTVTIMDYPTFFTPNGDGFNDSWNIVGIDISMRAKIYIFDRYGKLLKQISPYGQGWDGSYNGRLMPDSDYWFMVEYQDPLTQQKKEFKANFTLKR